MKNSPCEPVICYIALGSNMGDRRQNIELALSRLSDLEGVTLRQTSTLIETDPLGGPTGQDKFLNGAAEMATILPPLTLLENLKKIETKLGRPSRAARLCWGPRPIDLDILLYDDLTLDTPELTIPHPRMLLRPFVLIPLLEIAPDLKHPLNGQPIRAALESLTKR